MLYLPKSCGVRWGLASRRRYQLLIIPVRETIVQLERPKRLISHKDREAKLMCVKRLVYRIWSFPDSSTPLSLMHDAVCPLWKESITMLVQGGTPNVMPPSTA